MLTIALDKHGPVQAGSALSGQVLIQPALDCQCKEVELRLCWVAVSLRKPELMRTYPDGSGLIATQVISTDLELTGGIEHRVPFAWTIPTTPLTYHGETFNLDVVLEARARLTLEGQQIATKVLNVVAGASPEHAMALGDSRPPREPGYPQGHALAHSSGTSKHVALLALGLAALWASAALLDRAFAPSSSENLLGYGLYATLVFFFSPLFFILLFRSQRASLGDLEMGPVEMELDRRAVAPGDAVRCRLFLPAWHPVTLTAIRAHLECVEGSRYETTTTSGKTLHFEDEATTIERDLILPGSQDRTLLGATEITGEIPIPAENPLSVYAGPYWVHSRLRVTVEGATREIHWRFQDALWIVPPASAEPSRPWGTDREPQSGSIALPSADDAFTTAARRLTAGQVLGQPIGDEGGPLGRRIGLQLAILGAGGLASVGYLARCSLSARALLHQQILLGAAAGTGLLFLTLLGLLWHRSRALRSAIGLIDLRVQPEPEPAALGQRFACRVEARAHRKIKVCRVTASCKALEQTLHQREPVLRTRILWEETAAVPGWNQTGPPLRRPNLAAGRTSASARAAPRRVVGLGGRGAGRLQRPTYRSPWPARAASHPGRVTVSQALRGSDPPRQPAAGR